MQFIIELKPLLDDETLSALIKRSILEQQIKFSPYLLRLITIDQTPLSYVEGSMKLTQINLEASILSLEGYFQSNYFAACRDQESSDTHPFSMKLKYQEHQLIFDGEAPLQWLIEN